MAIPPLGIIRRIRTQKGILYGQLASSEMTYLEALNYLRDLEPRGWRLGLDRMQEFVRRAGLLDAVGSSEGEYATGGSPIGPQYIHVAGTNGKGSVTAFLKAMLEGLGLRTGAFFSPYVVDPRERVWFDRQMISEFEFSSIVARLRAVAESMESTEFAGVTEFEFKTAVGFEHWKLNHAEWVALEVGLGGRLDSTNVVMPRASVIVSIGLDHVNILGETYEQIAFEKAGIVKHGVPVVVGSLPAEAERVVLRVAEERQAPVWLIGRDFDVDRIAEGRFTLRYRSDTYELHPSLYGDFQGENAALAVVAIDVSGAGSAKEAALLADKAELPGRFQLESYQGRRLILDGAHNAEAAASLTRSLESYRERYPYRRVILVAGMVGGHDPRRFFTPLSTIASVIHLAPISFHRAIPTCELKELISGLATEINEHDSIELALDAAVQGASESDVVVVTGSFYLIGDVLRYLARSAANSQ